MSFLEATKSGFINCFNFNGRSSRSEYWYFALALGLISICILIIEMSTGMVDSIESTGPLSIIFSILTIIPSISIAARRLQDRGHSGWNQLWTLTIIGIILLIIIFMLPAKEDENQWGRNPLL
ncbi:DUF805 domain-containing protein [Gammaproteobacteria bacterium]|nr:DUF805 domain-containing protein [Gammaproteobacteria bacterium]